jgi:diaminohydroxyphosphoribosylaminopyrimidine deaminase/5-amino-6-(5-phosphoribosylamino)uracil reductase
LSREDEVFLNEALNCASNGFARTFPNPAVGCVLVRQDTSEIIGSGFHPRAGFPHAEVFALLEAAGHIGSGIEAAKSVVSGNPTGQVLSLSEKYCSEGGPKELFGDAFRDTSVTAYVTLEPCSHKGRTPPCANALLISKVDRVVVGFRDPNPRVDGGGVKMLQDAGITVDLAEGMAAQACMDMVDAFVKRITPKDYNTDYSWVNGAMRRKLRSLANRLKTEDSLTDYSWTGKVKASTEEEGDALVLDAMWMERLDFMLWQKELVNVRLNKAVGKKKMAKQLGERIAKELGAHVAQTVGHTALLYRPGVPPMLQVDDLLDTSSEQTDETEDESDEIDEDEKDS